MSKSSAINPIKYIINRQYKYNVHIKNKLFCERLAKSKNLYRKDLFAHYGCVNAIEFSIEGELLVSGGDDRRVLLWSVPRTLYGNPTPTSMCTTHNSNIFCVAFDSQNLKIFSGGNDDQVILHDVNTKKFISKLLHKKPVYGLHINPQNDDLIATAGDDGRILLYDVRETPPNGVQCLAKEKTGFHSVMFNPTNPRYLVTSNSEEGIALWDCRKPKEMLIRYDVNVGQISGISACFNEKGDRILALRRRLPPVLYDIHHENALCQFYHPQYYNSCTMKTCCFAGENDEYVLSGSDDFNLYMWRIPEDDNEWGPIHVVLKGHRSIVNQVRYNKNNNLIASSGVEKMVKLWSTLPIGTWKGSIMNESADLSRIVYSHEDYMHLVGHTERISHDYSDQSTQEDARMMAFFDSLIQREIEGWDSSSENTLSTDSDDFEKDYPNAVNQLFPNINTTDDHRKFKSNRIAQLIYKKRNRLARMAQNKSYNLYQKSIIKKFQKKSKKNSKTNKSNGYAERKHTTNRKDTPRQKRKLAKRNSSESMVNNTIDAPSTSTGITSSSNSSHYRIIEQDSDDEIINNHNPDTIERNGDGNNFVNILPTPLNGLHDKCLNVLEITNNENETRNESTQNYFNFTQHFMENNPYRSSISVDRPSTSRHRPTSEILRNNFYNIVDTATETTLTVKKTISNDYYSETDSELEYDYCTPVKKKHLISGGGTDSGCGTGPSSSTFKNHHQECSTYNNNINNDKSSDEEDYNNENNYEKFKRYKKARLNIRKRIVNDSDSN